MTTFTFTLSGQEKDYLKKLVRSSIHKELHKRDPRRAADLPPPESMPAHPPTDKLKKELGAFVTLKTGGELRGCIGHIVGDKPLVNTISEMACSAAFHDPRFPPLSVAEFSSLEVEISVLSPLEPCPDPDLIEPGRHGLIIRQGRDQGLLLPQVATEWGWDRETFLQQTCRKAGLPPAAWKDQSTTIHWFEAEVF